MHESASFSCSYSTGIDDLAAGRFMHESASVSGICSTVIDD